MVKRHYSVVWEDEAKASLRRIYNYIKKRESVDQAKKVLDEIKELAKNLGFIPHKYVKDPHLEVDPRDIRFKVIWSYKLVYEVTDELAIILDIIHSSRDPQVLKSIK